MCPLVATQRPWDEHGENREFLGTEHADTLVKNSAMRVFLRPDPAYGVGCLKVKSALNKWAREEHLDP